MNWWRQSVVARHFHIFSLQFQHPNDSHNNNHLTTLQPFSNLKTLHFDSTTITVRRSCCFTEPYLVFTKLGNNSPAMTSSKRCYGGFFLPALLLSTVSASRSGNAVLPPPCDSNIYCQGELLKTVQLAHLHPDSKHFVDMTLKFAPEQVYTNFEKLMEDTNNDPSKVQVGEFVALNFKDPGSEFEPWVPDDWLENPPFLSKIPDLKYKAWALQLNRLWKKLGRKISLSVKQNPNMFSQLYVDNPVIVPGGRFREFYYWDSYWTIDGLLLSGMTQTVRGMLQNFLDLVGTYGFVPNGGRVYYTRRSQPPYLIPMMKQYTDDTGDMEFVKSNIDLLQKELEFWLNNRTSSLDYGGKTYRFAQYNAMVDEPRPESYREDYEDASGLSAENKTQLYVEFKSGAESGWDYSSRWFVKGETNDGTLKDLHVTSLVPVDLNSLICYNAKILSDYYEQLGNRAKSIELQALHNEWAKMITDLLWDETDGVWYDLNLNTMKKRKYFFLSNIHPLYTDGYEGDRVKTVAKVIKYLKREGVLDMTGGVPTSKRNTGQQWDYPNAWAPLQHLIVMALQKNKAYHPDVEAISESLASKWIRNNWQGYVDTGAMFEKYNVEMIGAPGGGGEYDVQLGFGWSNGVALRFLSDFGDRLSSEGDLPDRHSSTTRTGTTLEASTAKGSTVSLSGVLLPLLVISNLMNW